MSGATNTEKNIQLFQERLKELRGERSLQEVATEIGISRATLGYYENGDRRPDIEILLRIADYYKVSCDYLLGLTEVSSLNLDIKEISEKTGLTDYSATILCNCKAYDDAHPGDISEKIYLDTINDIISCTLLENIAHYLHFHFDYAYDSKDSKKKIYTSNITFFDKGIGRLIELDSSCFSEFLMSQIESDLRNLRKIYQGEEENDSLINGIPFVSRGRLKPMGYTDFDK